MVRNNKGGKGGKKMARKHIVGNGFNAKLRVAQEEGEVYACVTKLLGNGMCHVNCLEENNTAKSRLCIIRNKFRGNGKRDNQLMVGTYVLVGVRSWETSRADTLEKCDLVEVYNKSEVDKLKSQVDKSWNSIHVAAIHDPNETDDMDDIFGFGQENEELKEELKEELQKQLDGEATPGDYLCGGEEVDVDDI